MQNIFFCRYKKALAEICKVIKNLKKSSDYSELNLVGEDGFGPSKHIATDLQSAPFGHSGTLPYRFSRKNLSDLPIDIGAGGRTRTPDLLITNQLLYQLSYTSKFSVPN